MMFDSNVLKVLLLNQVEFLTFFIKLSSKSVFVLHPTSFVFIEFPDTHTLKLNGIILNFKRNFQCKINQELRLVEWHLIKIAV